MKKKIREYRAILKIRKLFAKGYFPQRGDESYSPISPTTKLPYANITNCLGHACLNFTNNQLKQFTCDDSYILSEIMEYQFQPEEQIEKNFIKLIKACGLTIKKCKSNIEPKSNEWKVALYFSDYDIFSDYGQDFHFLRQEKDGTWSGKEGWNPSTHHFKNLPKFLNYNDCKYTLFGSYILSNPQAKAESSDENQI